MNTLSHVAACLMLVATACVTSAPSELVLRTLDASTQTRISGLVTEAEKRRLDASVVRARSSTPSEAFVNVVVSTIGRERMPLVVFFEAHNTQIDPPVRYVIAKDVDGSLYKVGGFNERAAEFNALAAKVLRRGLVEDSQSLQIVVTYFDVVERWEPGVVMNPGRAQKRGCRPQLTKREGGELIAKALVFDSASSRQECVTVELSKAHGVVVQERKVLTDTPRVEM